MPYNVQGILRIGPTHTFGRRSLDYIPSNYLITLRSTKKWRLSIVPKDTNTLALAGLELEILRPGVLQCSTRPHALSVHYGLWEYGTKGTQPTYIQDQSSVLDADILNNPRNNYYGRSSNYHIELSPKHQTGEFLVLLGG